MTTSMRFRQGADAGTETADRTLWWLAIGATVLNIVIGVMMLVWPDATLWVAAVLFGIWLIGHGVVKIAQAITREGMDTGERLLAGAAGVLFIVVGVVCLRNLVASLAVFITVIGIAWLISGVIEIMTAFVGRGTTGIHVAHAVLGLVAIAGGIVVLVWPTLALTTLVYITGFWLIALGVLQLALVIQARRAVTSSGPDAAAVGT